MNRTRVYGPKDPSQGTFMKWSDVEKNTSFVGDWKGSHKGDYGPLGDLQTVQGLLTFPMPTILARLLDEIDVGQRLEIIYTGMEKSEKTDRSYHTFEVYTLTDEDQVPF